MTAEGEGGFGFWDFAGCGMLLRLVGKSGTFREETSMSKDARKSVKLTDEAKKKFGDCVTAFAACGFGEDGPPVDTTFAEIEEFGHEVGRMGG